VGREAVAGFYEAADVFVLTSTREPYGTVYGEAMAAGLPVVGWAAGNLPYLAHHEEDGLIVPPGDLGALTDALRRMADDRALRERLAASARRKGRAFPTWQESAARLFGVLMASARRPR
jgi:glycosyltransferase involved in cell wall biosynthesis